MIGEGIPVAPETLLGTGEFVPLPGCGGSVVTASVTPGVRHNRTGRRLWTSHVCRIRSAGPWADSALAESLWSCGRGGMR